MEADQERRGVSTDETILDAPEQSAGALVHRQTLAASDEHRTDTDTKNEKPNERE
jgi:hypothetical protein